MTFAPNSTIYLCNVPFDNSYQNVVWFGDVSTQTAYFENRIQKTFSEYLTVRRTTPGGSLRTSIKLDCNIESLVGCNYVMYRNANHNNKWYYAFIVQTVYISEGCTEIEIECDVYQTWLFETELLPSYVEREHSASDELFEHLVPEKFSFSTYKYSTITLEELEEMCKYSGYLVGATESDNDVGGMVEQSGIFQGLHFHYFKRNQVAAMASYLMGLDKEIVQFISVVPQCAIAGRTDIIESNEYEIPDSEYAGGGLISYTFDRTMIDGYTPKNNKLFTAPFSMLAISNHNGQECELQLEYFTDAEDIQFSVRGDISAKPSMTMFPVNYKGVRYNYDSGINLDNFPQCSWVSDSYKLWLAKNQFGQGLSIATGVAAIGAGVATGNVIAAGGGVMAVLNSINQDYQARMEPNRANGANSNSNLLTALNLNRFTLYFKHITAEQAHIIDDFFTMYGYQCNMLKVPNVSSRPFFNYVRTVDCNIRGAIPGDDMAKLKSIYNSGVTLWKQHAEIGNYAVDNSPVQGT